jgi:hypothetical protein
VTVNDLSIGTHEIVASYFGDATYPGTDSVSVAQDVQPLPPVIAKFTPHDGTVGQKVTILGRNLASVSGVTFDSTPARVLTDSPTEITVRVPHGVHSGFIQIMTAGGIATSTKKFLVLP